MTKKEEAKNKVYHADLPIAYLNSTYNSFTTLMKDYCQIFRHQPNDVFEMPVNKLIRELRPVFEQNAIQRETELRKAKSNEQQQK